MSLSASWFEGRTKDSVLNTGNGQSLSGIMIRNMRYIGSCLFLLMLFSVSILFVDSNIVYASTKDDNNVVSIAFNSEAEYALSSNTITAKEGIVEKKKSVLSIENEPSTSALIPSEDKGGAQDHDLPLLIKPENTQIVNTPLGILYKKNDTASKAIDRSVSLFSERLRHRFSVWLERSARYLEIMKDILAERGLPEELVFLPIIESGFNMNAYSRASAVGPWQFISGTAKRYGLTIDWWRDERKDPVKSTEAAASYLKDLYKMFGAWNLALAAYNAGEGRIMRAMKSTGTDDYWDLLKTKKLHPETKEYVPRYIAATQIARMPEDYGFEQLDYHKPFEYEEITIKEPLDIDVIALCAETKPEVIRELNPELRRWSTPFNVSEYTVRVPVGSKELFFENLESVPANERVSVDAYMVQKGDTIKKIAQKTKFPVHVLLAMNSLGGIEELKPGETINLPPKNKFIPDIDDRKGSDKKAIVKKATYKKSEGKKKNSSKQKKAHDRASKSGNSKTKGKKI